MNRRQARKEAFLLLFQAQFREQEPLSQIMQIAQEERQDAEEYNDYVRQVYYGVWEKKEELDALIGENSRGWKLSRISRISLSLLRLATYEMLYVPDAPYHVAINEALELAKEYEEEKAVAFINGVLNAVAQKKGLKETQQKPQQEDGAPAPEQA